MRRAAAVTAVVLTVIGSSWAQDAPHPMPHHGTPDIKLCLTCTTGIGGASKTLETPLQLASASASSELDQAVSLPGAYPAIRIVRYTARAVAELKATAETGPKGRPAVEVLVEGPTQSHRRWLLADDPDRNRLVSLIGTWRYMAAQDTRSRDALLEQFRGELTRTPTVRVRKDDGAEWRELSAAAGTEQEIASWGCMFRVREFMSDFGIDKETKKPRNQSEKRRNPAVLIEIVAGEKKEERWVFAKFPGFKPKNANRLAFEVTLDCPIDAADTRPDIALVTIAGREHEAWVRHAGTVQVEPLKVGQRGTVAGSQYSFQIADFISSARLSEDYRAADESSKGTVAALLVRIESGPESASVWLEMGRERRVDTPAGTIRLVFGPQKPSSPHAPGHEAP